MFGLSRFGFRFFQPRPKILQAFDGLLGAAQSIKSEIELLARGDAQQKIANGGRGKTFLRQVTKRVVVAFRFRHRLAFDFQMFEVIPVAHKLLCRAAFALGNLVLVMREDKINTTEMQIESFPEIFHGHS